MKGVELPRAKGSDEATGIGSLFSVERECRETGTRKALTGLGAGGKIPPALK